jgi:hypothetical protein
MLANLGQVLDAARARGLWVYLTALEGNEMQKNPALKDYYWNLIIIQYFTKPRAIRTVRLFAGEAVADLLEQQTRDAFDLTTAVGAQMTILSKYRGLARKYFGLDLTRNYFTMPGYGESTTFGFALYGGIGSVTWYFMTYKDGTAAVNTLTDAEARAAMQFLTKSQSMFLGLGEIDLLLYSFFGIKVNLVDNFNMSITYQHDAMDTDTLFHVLEYTGSLPRPAGVSMTVVEV